MKLLPTIAVGLFLCPIAIAVWLCIDTFREMIAKHARGSQAQPAGHQVIRWFFLTPAICHGIMGYAVIRYLAAHATLERTPEASGMHTTAMHDLILMFGNATGWVLLAIAVTGALSPFLHRWNAMLSWMLLIPQQVAMTLAGHRAYQCIRHAQFADGAPYDPNFILGDQPLWVIIGIMHLLAVLHVYLSPTVAISE